MISLQSSTIPHRWCSLGRIESSDVIFLDRVVVSLGIDLSTLLLSGLVKGSDRSETRGDGDVLDG
jgi:hypothetical protein